MFEQVLDLSLLLEEGCKELHVAASRGMPAGEEGRRLISTTIARTVVDEGRALVLAVNKWDLVRDRRARRRVP